MSELCGILPYHSNLIVLGMIQPNYIIQNNYYLSTINNDNSFGEVLNCLFENYNYNAIMGFDANWSKFTYTKKQNHFAILENK